MQVLPRRDRRIVSRCRVTSLLPMRVYRAHHVPDSAIRASERVLIGSHPQFFKRGMPVLMCWSVLFNMSRMKRPSGPIEFIIIGRVIILLMCSTGSVERLASSKIRTATVSHVHPRNRWSATELGVDRSYSRSSHPQPWFPSRAHAS